MHEIIGHLNILEIILIFFLATLLISHIGVTWSGILLQEGNIFDFLPPKIEKIKSPYIQNLLECPKCISGQFALWTYVGTSIHFGIFHWFFSIVLGIAWVCWIIAVTDQLHRLYGYK
ncbi:MAG TPA: hypothetical protein VMZ69_01810 [Saprospiraceae bacterium]|nr:hypothetical protein [Saprospiraceae bacterium]